MKHGDRGGTVVRILCYKSEGRWFDSKKKRKAYQPENRGKLIANFLTVLDT
jgi:hypothetical protein